MSNTISDHSPTTDQGKTTAEDKQLSKPSIPLTQQQFDSLKERVIMFWPSLQSWPKERDKISFYDYAASFVRANPHEVTSQRRKDFAAILEQELRPILGNEIAASVRSQLAVNHSLSTAQHFTPFSHPKTLNPTLQNALPYFDTNTPATQNVIVLSCSEVSFDNGWFPRGLQFHALANNEIHEQQLVFFPRKVRPFSVMNFPGYSTESVEKMKHEILSLWMQQKISKEVRSKLEDLMETVYSTSKVLSLPKFSDQVTATSYLLWKKIFADYPGHVPNLIFFSQEQVVIALLLAHHMDQETIIHKLLFDPRYGPELIKNFNGIQCAFDVNKDYGTYLFWAHPKNSKYRTKMWVQDNALVSADGSLKVALTPDRIREALQNHEIVPSSMLSFIMLSFYYGMILSGGMDQTTYLTEMKQAYINTLTACGDTEEIETCLQTPTTDLTITRPTLVYIEGENGYREPATGVDLALYSGSGSWQQILTASKQTTLDNIFDRLLPNLYDEYCPSGLKQEDLSGITEREIEKLTGLDTKIPAYATLR